MTSNGDLQVESQSNADVGLYQVGLRAVYPDDPSEGFVCSVELQINEAEDLFQLDNDLIGSLGREAPVSLESIAPTYFGFFNE